MQSLTRLTPLRRATARQLLLLVPACQIGAILWLIWTRTPHVPDWDEWELTNFLVLTDLGRLQLATFWGFHNEHRIVIPNLVLFALILLTHWNRQLLMTFNLGIGIAMAALIFGSIRRTIGATGYAILFVPTSLLLLSAAHFENWLLPFQATFIWTSFGVACCLRALTATRPGEAWWAGGFWLAVLGASVASLSAVNGLLAWPAFLPAVWRRGWWARLVWCLFALAITIPYFIGFPAGRSARVSLLAYADYTLVYLGSPVAASSLTDTSVFLARMWGGTSLVLMAGLVVAYRRHGGNLQRIAAWIGLALYGLGTALLSAYGRAAFGLQQALTPRYRLFSMVWWVALLVLAWLVIDRHRRNLAAEKAWAQSPNWEVLAGAGIGIPLVLGVAWANVGGFQDGQHWQDPLRRREGCVLDYPAASNSCLELFYASAPIARIHAAYLEQHHLAAFRETTRPTLAELPATGAALSTIDTVNGAQLRGETLVAAPDTPVVIRGWAVDAASQAPASDVYAMIDNRYTYRASYGAERPDVATATHIPAYERSGFTITLPPGMLSPGRHVITIVIVAHDAQAYAIAPQQVAIVIPGG